MSGMGFRRVAREAVERAQPSELYAMHGGAASPGRTPTRWARLEERPFLNARGPPLEEGAEELLHQVGPLPEQVEQIFALDLQRRSPALDHEA